GGGPGPTPPDWCGTTSGDLALDPLSGVFYSSITCPACRGDALVTVAPQTGAMLGVVGCLADGTGKPLGDVLGLGVDGAGTLWGVQGIVAPTILRIDPATAVATVVPVSGGFRCATGLAVLPCGCQGPDPVPPDQGNVLRAVRRSADVDLTFRGAPAPSW